MTPTVPEPFSSTGPNILTYGPWTGTTPASPLPTPEVRNGPDLLSVDDVQTTFFSPPMTDGVFRFIGTSAAAPSAAGVVALGLQLAPNSSPEQVRAALLSSAIPTPSPYEGVEAADVTGAGLIDAVGFLQALTGPPAPLPSPLPAPVSAPAELAATGGSADAAPTAALLAALGAALLAAGTGCIRRRVNHPRKPYGRSGSRAD